VFDLSGQFAVATGAAAGIGEVIAVRLANAGATVCIADIDGTAATSAAVRIGKRARSIAIDVADSASVSQAVATILTQSKTTLPNYSRSTSA
jgi:NAD(P)-dependent dehydrogenase (short-subunit alcohol dehydrogenase family)